MGFVLSPCTASQLSCCLSMSVLGAVKSSSQMWFPYREMPTVLPALHNLLPIAVEPCSLAWMKEPLRVAHMEISLCWAPQNLWGQTRSVPLQSWIPQGPQRSCRKWSWWLSWWQSSCWVSSEMMPSMTWERQCLLGQPSDKAQGGVSDHLFPNRFLGTKIGIPFQETEVVKANSNLWKWILKKPQKTKKTNHNSFPALFPYLLQ